MVVKMSSGLVLQIRFDLCKFVMTHDALEWWDLNLTGQIAAGQGCRAIFAHIWQKQVPMDFSSSQNYDLNGKRGDTNEVLGSAQGAMYEMLV